MTWSRSVGAVLLGLAVLLGAVNPTLALAEPLTVSLPTLGVEARTESLQVIDGQLGTPNDPDNVGIYQLPGNLLLVGHVDWAGQLRPFAALRGLSGGEPIHLSDGRRYHVAWISAVDTQSGAVGETFAPGDDVLTLITCTGPFSLSQHSYRERLVVRAVRDAP